MRHATKDKGDLGVGHVISDLLKNGIQPAILLSEHLPFDCIAISKEAILKRISVKYRKLDKNGRITVELRSVWSDRKGVHTSGINLSLVDAFAIYCPDTSEVYYVRTDEIRDSLKSICLRVRPSKNNQSKGVSSAISFLGAARIFV
jgi:hypothetical protein